uniref:Uncharacterized protein n=1 Tax=viral metagenome TaxID=1070528 RepID=A0A6C0F3T7_9ZZZZ|tara:strand:- start:2154 stop:2501 length:348 start_codon:yes stop_codon:yes gene_type:complete
MVHKNYKWNISKEKGEKILKEKIKEILVDSRNLTTEYDELSFALNHRTKDIIIKNNNKSKNLSNFIKNVLGGLTYYIENNEDFLIFKENEKVYVTLMYDPEKESSEWVIVDEDCY